MSSFSKARQRITALLDENSFVEIGARVTARATDFNLKSVETPSDGVVTGYGVIDGNLVYVYSQDASVLGGSVGEMHARKIAAIYDLAIRTGAPVIGLFRADPSDHGDLRQLRRRPRAGSRSYGLCLHGKGCEAVRKCS